MSSGNIVELSNHDALTVEEALALTLRRAANYESVVIVARIKDDIHDDGGCIMLRTSKLSVCEANWMLDRAKITVMRQSEE